MKQSKLNSTTRNLLLIGGAFVLVMFVLSAWAWTQLPAGSEIPVHWNAAGEVDRYGSKFTGLLLLPLISAAIILMFLVIPRIDPRGQNILRSTTAYNATIVSTMLIFLVIHIITIFAALGREVNVTLWVSLIVGVMFIAIGNFMGKIRQNYTFGIKTPWTYASKLSWDKTHRLGGKLFMLVGFLMIISGFLPALWFVYILLGSVFGMLIVLFTYSYVVWKNDPNAQTS
jgi:uncharacterized membrane protein